MAPSPRPVVVFGGTGLYGSRVVRHVLGRGALVRVISRNAASARSVVGDAPEIVEGDITSHATVERALHGARSAVVCVSSLQPKLIRRRRQIERDAVLTILEEAKRAGVTRVVYFSGYDVREELLRELDILPVGDIQLEIEAALRASDLDWTVLGCPPSHEMFFAMLRGSRLVIPGGGPPALPTISPEDVGEVAAQAALRDDLGGRRLRMAGPETLSFPEAARRLSAVLGRKIEAQAVPLLAVRVVAGLARPFNPFLQHVAYALRLLNAFPQDLAARAPDDHRLLRETFDFAPRSFEDDARAKFGAAASAPPASAAAPPRANA